MKHTYVMFVHANWGMSRPNRIDFGKDKDKAISTFKNTHCGGTGNVVRVTLERDGVVWKTKIPAEQEEN